MASTTSLYKSPAAAQAVLDFCDSMLARWPVPYEARTVPTRFGETYLIASGEASAPPLILLHGAGTNATTWLGDIAMFSRAFRAYAVDIIGEPGRSAPSRPSYQGPAYADWLLDVFDALEIEQAAVVGVSQGGWAALKFATTYPERVAGMALLAPGGVVPERLSFMIRAIPLALMGPLGAARLRRLFLDDTPMPPEIERFMDIIFHDYRPRLDGAPPMPSEALRRLTMPVLLISGDRDAIRDGAKIAARLEKHLPNFRAILVPGAGHVLVDQGPNIMAFLTQEMREAAR